MDRLEWVTVEVDKVTEKHIQKYEYKIAIYRGLIQGMSNADKLIYRKLYLKYRKEVEENEAIVSAITEMGNDYAVLSKDLARKAKILIERNR